MLYDAALRNLQTLSEATQPVTVTDVIQRHLAPLEACMREMLAMADPE